MQNDGDKIAYGVTDQCIDTPQDFLVLPLPIRIIYSPCISSYLQITKKNSRSNICYF